MSKLHERSSMPQTRTSHQGAARIFSNCVLSTVESPQMWGFQYQYHAFEGENSLQVCASAHTCSYVAAPLRTTVERRENTSLAQPVGINRKHEQRQGKEGKCEEKGGKTEKRERRQNKG